MEENKARKIAKHILLSLTIIFSLVYLILNVPAFKEFNILGGVIKGITHRHNLGYLFDVSGTTNDFIRYIINLHSDRLISFTLIFSLVIYTGKFIAIIFLTYKSAFYLLACVM